MGHDRARREHKVEDQQNAVLQLWREIGGPAVDTRVLRQIHERMVARFGDAAAASPALIARIIADAGGELRHPDVIELDAEWRQSQAERHTTQFSGLETLTSGEPLDLHFAEKVLVRLEQLRLQYEGNADQETLAHLRTLAVEARNQAQLIAKHTADDSLRAEQTEVAEWLKVWLQTPNLFGDWLELRKRSENFRSRFGLVNHKDTKTRSDNGSGNL